MIILLQGCILPDRSGCLLSLLWSCVPRPRLEGGGGGLLVLGEGPRLVGGDGEGHALAPRRPDKPCTGAAPHPAWPRAQGLAMLG